MAASIPFKNPHFDQGMRAYCAEKVKDSCPHLRASFYWDEWHRGWEFARDVDKFFEMKSKQKKGG